MSCPIIALQIIPYETYKELSVSQFSQGKPCFHYREPCSHCRDPVFITGMKSLKINKESGCSDFRKWQFLGCLCKSHFGPKLLLRFTFQFERLIARFSYISPVLYDREMKAAELTRKGNSRKLIILKLS